MPDILEIITNCFCTLARKIEITFFVTNIGIAAYKSKDRTRMHYHSAPDDIHQLIVKRQSFVIKEFVRIKLCRLLRSKQGIFRAEFAGILRKENVIQQRTKLSRNEFLHFELKRHLIALFINSDYIHFCRKQRCLIRSEER